MAEQTILWVAPPKGFLVRNSTRKASLSIFVSPRLRGADRLGAFDFLDWPAQLQPERIEFEVAFGSTSVRARVSSEPDSGLWRALFNGATFVRAPGARALSPLFSSYPAAPLHDDLKAAYQHVCAQAPIDTASPQVVAAAFGDLHHAFAPSSPSSALERLDETDRERRIRLADELFRPGASEPLHVRVDRLVDLAARESAARDLAAREHAARESHEDNPAVITARAPIPVVPDNGSVTNRFAQFTTFHQQRRGHAAPAFRTAGDTALDFHQRVSALGDYGGLLRKLGLVIDIEIEPDDVPAAAAATPGLVRVVPKMLTPLGVTTTHLTPATAYASDGRTRFRAAPSPISAASRDIVDGLLNLQLATSPDRPDVPQFRLVQVDVDGAAFRALELLDKAARADGHPAAARHGDFAMPPLRSSGLSVVRNGHPEQLLTAVDRGRETLERIASGEPLTLFAESLIRGYRIDVHDRSGWRSLHAREGTFTFPTAGRELSIVEENSIQPAIVQPPPPASSQPAPTMHDPAAPNYISESLFLWQGWSLAATRPGKTLEQPGERGRPAPTPAHSLDLTTTFNAAPGSLPRLRFGDEYHVRARIVDLACNSVTLDEANAMTTAPVLPAADEGFAFRRFEVVSSPTPVLRAPRQQSEGVDRIVLRSTHDASPEAFVSQNPRYEHTAERHIAPPKVSQTLAEMFGLFDASIGRGADLSRTYALARRDAGSLADGASASTAGRPAAASDADPVHPEPSLSLTYLPDPLAAGVTFRNLPGATEDRVGRVTSSGVALSPLPELPPPTDAASAIQSLTQVDFGPVSAWPDLRPFRLRLAEGSGAPAWDDAARMLTVRLSKGESQTVSLGCHLRGDAELQLLGIWAWMTEWLREQEALGTLSTSAHAQRLETFRQQSLLGLWWMLTPPRELTLVHAVQQPIHAPRLSGVAAFKIPGATFAYLKGRVQVHGATTGTMDLVARWTEKVDDDPNLPPRDVPSMAQIFTTPLHRPTDVPADSAPRPDDAFPPAQFDAAADTVHFEAPSFEGLQEPIERAARQLLDHTSEMLRAANALRPRHPRLVELATDMKAMSQDVLALTPTPPWTDIPALANQVAPTGLLGPGGLPEFLNLPDEILNLGAHIEHDAGVVAATAAQATATLKRFQCRQEFGDTRHRLVRYQAVGTTRFRGYFHDDEPGGFSRASDEVAVSVLSSARPPAPKVLYTIPAFGWETTRDAATGVIVRQRRGGGVRVYLARPWFASGEGELLGVILPARRGDHRNPHVTRWGRDPIWHTDPPAQHPMATDFRNAVRIQSGLRLPRENADAPSEVIVVGHAVQFDETHQRYYADIEIDSGRSYFPFVRLVVARYQPESMDGVHLSRAVSADFAQLTPHRTVTLTPAAADANRFDITVEGLTYHANAWHAGDVEFRQVQWRRPVRPFKEFELNPGRPLIQITVQEHIRGTTDEAGWQTVSEGQSIRVVAASAVTAGVDVPAGGRLLWHGHVTLPATRTPGQFRVVIKEQERVLTGVQATTTVRIEPDDDPGLPPGSGGPDRADVISFPGADRLVFADAIVL